MGGGQDLDTGFGRDVLDHPLNAVAWLAQDLQKHGLALKKGDLVSVGSFSKLMPPKAGPEGRGAVPGPARQPVGHGDFR